MEAATNYQSGSLNNTMHIPSELLTTVAYYLGQFHPIAENNRFWGDGFTEWHNVAKARALYPGHEQPKLPGRFGFYDLRCSSTLREQMHYSRQIGIDAFCFWHYWFAGKRLLHAPLDDMLSMGDPDFKFMLAWANETWSGIWHGSPKSILIAQTYGKEELKAHCNILAQYMSSGSYLTLDGKYPLVIYKPKQIPDPQKYFATMRNTVKELSGKEIYLIGNWSPGRSGEFVLPSQYGLDAAVITPVARYFGGSLTRSIYTGIWKGLRQCGIGPEVRSYSEVSRTLRSGRRHVQGISHATVVTGWDNTPRSGRRALVLSGYHESTFRQATQVAVNLELENSNPLLFIKSWNEWAEGNVIEPLFHETWSAGAVLKSILGTHD